MRLPRFSPGGVAGLALAVMLAAAVIGAAVLLAPASAQDPLRGVPVWPQEPTPVPPASCCRWELVELVPWERHWEALREGGPAIRAIEAVPPVLLLDQCSGRTWTLGYLPGPGGHDWRMLRREGID